VNDRDLVEVIGSILAFVSMLPPLRFRPQPPWSGPFRADEFIPEGTGVEGSARWCSYLQIGAVMLDFSGPDRRRDYLHVRSQHLIPGPVRILASIG
jgi:hypothetical protein